MPQLFAATLLVSALLLFMVQPMVGKMVLPLLGGSPAVWNTCMVFFQALLLLGYLYAHWLSTRFEPRRQWVIHLCVLLVPVGTMAVAALLSPQHTPISIAESLAPGEGSASSNPFVNVLTMLSVAIGVPFFVASTSAPLLQRWFGFTGHPASRDPYFLYAASNFGSMVSLLGYPLFIEPGLSPVGQAWVWAGGFAALVAMIFLCGRAASHPLGIPPAATRPAKKSREPAPTTTPEVDLPLAWARKARWIMLAFVPSSLMLGVTTYITTDIASVPLLWVIPLTLYLITFIIAFSTLLPSWFRSVIGNLAPVSLLLLVFIMTSEVTGGKIGLTLLMHIGAFFAAALMCHYELAHDRPSPRHLTEFFLWISVGGVLGGIFNALLAPVIFPMTYEYQTAIILACFMVPPLGGDESNENETDETSPGKIVADQPRLRQRIKLWTKRNRLVSDIALPALVGALFYFLLHLPSYATAVESINWVKAHTGLSYGMVEVFVVYATPVMLCFLFVDRPVRFGLAVAAILIIKLSVSRDQTVIYSERSFFGVLKVEDWSREGSFGDPDHRVTVSRTAFRRLVHGTTLHGTQMALIERHPFDDLQLLTGPNPWDVVAVMGAIQKYDPRLEPLTYYHRTGPVGAMFHELRTRKGGTDATAPFAMVGLGTGSVSCYALPGQKLTFYEIDPAVKKLVADTDQYFTYVTDARNRGAELDFRMGDARLKLKEDRDRRYALLLVDAFSSDSIPIHLLTKEAVQLYLNRLTPDGILALHISNKYVQLEPVVAEISQELGLSARVWHDYWEPNGRRELSRDEEHHPGPPGKTISTWVVLARDEKDLGLLAASPVAQVMAFGAKSPALADLLRKYGPDAPARETIIKEYGDESVPETTVRNSHGLSAAYLRWYALVQLDPVKKLPEGIKLPEPSKPTVMLGTLVDVIHGYGTTPMFHPLARWKNVTAWTDDYSDVLRVMSISELQWVRKAFGLPVAEPYDTPVRSGQ